MLKIKGLLPSLSVIFGFACEGVGFSRSPFQVYVVGITATDFTQSLTIELNAKPTADATS